MSIEIAGGFACPSGCIGPGTCVNRALIQGLSDISQGLVEASTPEATQILRITEGGISPLEVRSDTVETIQQALLGSCALFAIAHQRHSRQQY